MSSQQEPIPVDKNLRDQRIKESMVELWQIHHQQYADILSSALELTLHLPQTERAVGFTIITQHLFSHMSLHMLDIMAIFQQKAEVEGMSIKDRQEITEQTFSRAFEAFETIRKQLCIKSLDNLARFNNITIGLYGLSKVDSAEEAASWLYMLPEVYLEQLREDNMLLNSEEKIEPYLTNSNTTPTY